MIAMAEAIVVLHAGSSSLEFFVYLQGSQEVELLFFVKISGWPSRTQ